MKRTTKVIVTTAAIVGLGAASISMVSAHGGFNGPGGCGGYGGSQQWQQGHGPMMQRGFMRHFGSSKEQFMQQRLDQAKYKLRITEEQEPAWKILTDTIGQKVDFMRNHMQNAEHSRQWPSGFSTCEMEQIRWGSWPVQWRVCIRN